MESKHRVLLWILTLLACVAAADAFYRLFAFGESGFHNTLLVYALLGAGSHGFVRALRWPNLLLSVWSIVAVLLVAEVFLRFIREGPLTYTEMNGEGYVSIYRADAATNWHVMRREGRKDLLTVEWAPYEVRNNTSIDFPHGAYSYTANALGLRGDVPTAISRTVVALGDSCTEGAGTSCDSTYPKLLEELLRRDDPSWTVLNAGVSGNDPFFDWQMLRKLHLNYPMERVIFLVNTTDINDVMMRGGMERFLPSGKLNYRDAPWWEPIYAVSFVSRLFFHGVMGVGMDLLKPEEKQALRREALKQMRDLFENHVGPFGRKNGVRVCVVAMPMRHEVQSPWGDYTALIGALADMPGIELADLRPTLADAADVDGLYWPNDGHFRPGGYALMSEKIHQVLFTH